MHFVLLIDRTDKCTGWWHCESTLKDEMPEPRGSLVNNIPSRAIEQANQEFRLDDRHSQHASNQASMHSNFHIFIKFCVLFNFVY